MAQTTAILADSNGLTREMLALACERRAVQVLSQVAEMEDLVPACAEFRPAVAVVSDPLGDVRLEGWVEKLAGMGPRIVVRTSDASPETITGILRHGVSGYVLDDMPTERVVEAVKLVAAGAVYLHPVASATILGQWRQLRTVLLAAPHRRAGSLTVREFDVLRAMADGLATKAIARHLGVAPKTVENHKIRIFDKLHARSQAHAVSIAISHGLLQSPDDKAPAGAVDQGPAE